MLTTDELAQVRSDAKWYLPDWAHLLAPTLTDDGGGASDAVWSMVWSGKGRVAPIRADERAFAEAVKTVAEMIATLPWDCPATERMRLVIGDVPYEVLAVNRGHSYQLHVRAALVGVR